MKSGAPPFRNQQKQSKPFFKVPPPEEKRLQMKTKNITRLKIVQKATAGHIRGGHSFH